MRMRGTFEVRLPTILPEFDDAFRDPSAMSASKTLLPYSNPLYKVLAGFVGIPVCTFTANINIC